MRPSSTKLMEIPRLPVRLSEIDELREHAALFRRLATGYTVRSDDAEGAPDSLLMEVDGEVTTSVLGDVAWARHRSTLFAEKLLSPLSAKVRASAAVQKVFAGLEAVVTRDELGWQVREAAVRSKPKDRLGPDRRRPVGVRHDETGPPRRATGLAKTARRKLPPGYRWSESCCACLDGR